MKPVKQRRFSEMIIIMPVFIIIFTFLLIFVSFHFLISSYIDGLTKENLKTEFKILDEIYHESEDDDYILWGMQDASSMIPIEYLILDDQKQILFASEYFYLQTGMETADFIAQYASKHKLPLDGETTKLKIEDKAYLISGKYYEGICSEDFFIKASSQQNAKNYLYIIYMDITAMQMLMNTVNKSLMMILICVGGLSMVLVFKRLKKVRQSFASLEQHLVKVGNREAIQQLPQFSYTEFSHIVETVDEMSRRIAQSEQLQKQFFQNASHELRTPLMSIQGYAEGLKYHVIKDTESCYDVILQESRRMSDLVDEILFLSKFETLPFEKEPVAVDDLLYTCANQVYISQYHQIEILWDIEKELSITGDETLLQRAFSNILSNALRYAKTKVEIFARIQQGALNVHIIDDGAGITPQDMPHIFERFYKGQGGNFGIGLSMTKDIIEKHGGKISVDSKEGATDFCVILPLTY